MSDPNRVVRVYGLYDARDPEQRVRYVGITSTRISDRLNRHRYTARQAWGRGRVIEWMRDIGPKHAVAVELEACTWADRHEREAWWIDKKQTLAEQGGLNDSHGSRMSAAESARRAAVWADSAQRDQRIAAARVKLHRSDVNARVRAGNISANHSRWHAGRGVIKDGCELCEKS